ncbi:MAG: hypothetical protein AAGA93_23800, partial [Actinomycetota bacterium]
IAVALAMALTAVGLALAVGSAPADAHAGHGHVDEVEQPSIERRPSQPLRAMSSTRSPQGDQALIELAAIDPPDTGFVLDYHAPTPRLFGTVDRIVERLARPGKGLTVGPAPVASVAVDCFVDFDDDLVLQYTIPNAAEDTFMTNHWYQSCAGGSSYPAVAVEYMEYGHFHLGYEDPKVGPCSGDTTDWGRKSEPAPADSDDLAAWTVLPCVSDIDPVTEPRSGISPHWPGHRAKVFAYEGHTDTEYLPFRMETLQVVDGEVEVCHLPPGPIIVMGGAGAGSPWQCVTVGEGYWNMGNLVDSAIEVRIEFLTYGMIDNIGVDLL